MFAHDSQSRLLQEVVARATWDLQFRRRLLDDPVAAIRDTFGVAVPERFRLRFMEKPSDLDLLVVLPDVRRPDEELDDDELDQVAGGGDTEFCTW